MEKKEIRKKIEELKMRRKVNEIKGEAPDYDTDNQYHYISEEDILELLDEAREEERKRYKKERAKKLAKDIINIQNKKEPYRDLENIHIEIDDRIAEEIGGEVLELYKKQGNSWGWYS